MFALKLIFLYARPVVALKRSSSWQQKTSEMGGTDLHIAVVGGGCNF